MAISSKKTIANIRDKTNDRPTQDLYPLVLFNELPSQASDIEPFDDFAIGELAVQYFIRLNRVYMRVVLLEVIGVNVF
jgi:hypothetical protein